MQPLTETWPKLRGAGKESATSLSSPDLHSPAKPNLRPSKEPGRDSVLLCRREKAGSEFEVEEEHMKKERALSFGLVEYEIAERCR